MGKSARLDGPHRLAARLSLLYAVVAFSWLYGASALLTRVPRPELGRSFPEIHGAAVAILVVATALGLFVAARRSAARLGASRAAAGVSEARYRLLADAFPDTVVVHGNHVIEYANTSASAVLGLKGDAGVLDARFSDLVHPDERAPFEGRLGDALRDGAPLPLEERRLRVRDGTELEVETAVFPYATPEGPRALYVLRDVTERKRQVHQRIERSRLETLGRLAAEISHDLNNVLTAVIGFAELTATTAVVPEARDNAQSVIEAAERAVVLTRRILEVSRRGIGAAAVVDLRDVIESVLPLLEKLLPPQITLRFEAPAAAAKLFADPYHVEQILMNLVLNARDAIEGNGSILVAVDRVEEPSAAGGGPGEGPWIRLRVRDDGAGMSPEVLRRARERFFTTKPEGRGTGIGLSLVEELVGFAGGRLRIESAPDAGTTVEIRFPTTGAKCDGADSTTEASTQTREGPTAARILVAEDDPHVRALLVRVLESEGHEVTEAADGADALAKITAAPRPYDLLVTDVEMPGMRGPELAERARDRHPSIAVLAIAGGAVEGLRGAPGARTRILRKPFTTAQIAAAVAEILEGR